MAKYALCSFCVNRMHHLTQTIPSWLAQEGDVDRVVTTIRGCGQRTHFWVPRIYPQVKMLELDQEKFNVSYMRNLAIAASQSEWVVSLDGDCELNPGFLNLLDRTVEVGGFYTSTGWEGAGVFGTTVMRREDFIRAGGYEPRLNAGWGSDDHHFWKKLKALGLEYRCLPGLTRRHIDHGDNDRAAAFEEKDCWASDKANWAMSEHILPFERVREGWRAQEYVMLETFEKLWLECLKIKGYLTKFEAYELFETAARLPKDAVILEIGAYNGRSTAVLAASGRKVVTVDPLPVGKINELTITEEDVASLTAVVKANPNVTWVREKSTEAPHKHTYDMVFIDGCHEYPAPVVDLMVIKPRLRRGAAVLYHDWSNKWPGVVRSIVELMASNQLRKVRERETMWCGWLC